VCSGHILWEETKCRHLAITAIVKYYRTETIRLNGVEQLQRKLQNELMNEINRAELHDIFLQVREKVPEFEINCK